MPNKYLNDTRTGELIQKIYTADRAIATECKGYTDTKVAALVDSAPGTLDTLNELATALGNDPNFATTIATLIDTKCAQAKLDAHPVGSFYESTDSTSPATLFGGTWQEQIPDGELIGTVAAFSSNTLPTGWLLCDGSAVSRTTYAALFAAVGTTYGSGDGSTTFALPNLTDKFIQGSSTAGTVKDAGLPNLYGSFNIRGLSNGNAIITAANPPFSRDDGSSTIASTTVSSTSATYTSITFDASTDNPIYGNSTTVQPPALTMKYAIYTGVTSNHKWVRQS